MTSDLPDLARLARLRERFLAATDARGPVTDYWRDDEDLAAYDAVFAARIGWKWDSVLDELVEQGFGRADGELVVDFGCGTGVASRRFASALGAGVVAVHDRSARAMAFAAQRVREELGVESRALTTIDGVTPDVLLISHVLDELDARAERELLELVMRSRRVVWVEPGSRAVSRLLSAHRDRLRQTFRAVAPCPHQDACSVLADPDDRHWCHFFARAPSEVFVDGGWVKLGKQLGVDLRALPYAFLALDRGDRPPTHDARLLGRPAISSHEARVHVCTPDGLQQLRMPKRDDPALFRTLKKHPERVRRLAPGPPRADDEDHHS